MSRIKKESKQVDLVSLTLVDVFDKHKHSLERVTLAKSPLCVADFERLPLGKSRLCLADFKKQPFG